MIDDFLHSISSSTTRVLALGALLLLGTIGPLTAQTAQLEDGDRAWGDGRFPAAQAAYERALVFDPYAVRALYRLALLESWDGRLDSSLVLLRRARLLDPEDPDLQVAEGRVLSWANRLGAAQAAYDSVLARRPGYVDARVGRAEVIAWRGDLGAAAREYTAILDEHPDAVTARVGLAQIRFWQGREDVASRELDRALAIEPAHREGVALRRSLRAGHAPRAELSVVWTNDSDDNTSWTESLDASMPLGAGVRALGGVALLQASDPLRHARRIGGEAGLSWARGPVQLMAAAGARRLEPDGAAASAATRTEATWRGRLDARLSAGTSLALAYAHAPFDETAFLFERDLELDALDLNLETTLGGTSLSIGAGHAWVSDGNRRRSVVLGVTQTVARGFFVGALGRAIGWERQDGVGYFDPDRFALAEGRAGWQLATPRWEARVSGGVGVQQIFRDADAQAAWHAEARLARRLGDLNAVEVFGGVTNSVVTSTTGAYRFRTAGLRVRLGL